MLCRSFSTFCQLLLRSMSVCNVSATFLSSFLQSVSMKCSTLLSFLSAIACTCWEVSLCVKKKRQFVHSLVCDSVGGFMSVCPHLVV